MAREYRLYRVKTPYGTAPWQVDSGQKKRSLYPIVEEATAIDSRDVEPLVEALREAVDMVADWASYASPYFQEKWDLDGDLAKLRAALQTFTQENNESEEE